MRTINFYYDRWGVEKNKKYLLLDPDGNEITVNELVDKYLSNPELCFKKDYQEPSSHSVLSNLIYVETIQKNNILHHLPCSNILTNSYNDHIEDSSIDLLDKEDFE